MQAERQFISRFDLMAGLLISLIPFPVVLYFEKNLFLATGVSLAFFAFLSLTRYFDGFFEARRQAQILDAQALTYLRSIGFKKANLNGLPCLHGEYRGFWITVYYSQKEKFNETYARTVVFVASGKYPKEYSPEQETSFLQKKHKQYKTGLFSRYAIEWYSDSAVYKLRVGLANPGKDRLLSHLNRFVKILEHEEIKTVPLGL